MRILPILSCSKRNVPFPSRAGAALRAVLLLFVFALAAAGGSARAADPWSTKFDPKSNAERDVAAAVSVAKAAGKHVIVDVGGEWCGWCHVMDRFVLGNPDLRGRIEANYVWVKVNFSKENLNEAFLARWPKIQGFPHLVVLDGTGKMIAFQDTSELESGKDYDRQRFAAFVEKYAPKAPGRAAR